MKNIIIHGKAENELSQFPDNSIGALVTDPPAGINFMNKDWDSDKGSPGKWIYWLSGIMSECLRVLKPGAYGLVWALPRISHRTALACELAGFHIKDIIYHLFNTGFPKSFDISKAIDREAGAEREVVGKGKTSSKRYCSDYNLKESWNITASATDETKKWNGWGTALKPCIENWILIQKPKSEKTIAENVLKWNTGGINIDGCRVPMEQADFDAYKNKIVSFSSCTNKKFPGFMTSPLKHNISKKGRWPAQLIHDGSQAVMNEFEKYGEKTKRKLMNHEGSVGSIARFFYCAKESPQNKKSRIEGAEIDHPTVKSEKLMKYLITLITPPGETILDPFAGSGSTGYAGNKLGFSCILIEQDKHNFDLIINSLKTLEKYKEPELFNAEEIQNLTYKEKENFNDKPR